MGKTIKLRKYMRDSLRRQYERGHGTKKHENGTQGRIYSHNTYNTYLRACDAYTDFCYSRGVRLPEPAKELVGAYVASLQAQGKSAWSIYTSVSGIAKAFGCSISDFNVVLPERRRTNIKRSRQAVAGDATVSIHGEQYRILRVFGQCFGLRRSELQSLQVQDVQILDNAIICHVRQGKGGKSRNSLFYGSAGELATIKRYIEQTGEGRLFPKAIDKDIDIHAWRAQYACRVYKAVARPINTLSHSELYYCRGDLKGRIYDRHAMLQVSRLLGHNRLDLVAGHYLYTL